MATMFKRTSALLVTVVLAASLFAGCGQSSSQVPATSQQVQVTSAQPASTAKAQEPVTLRFTTWVNNKDLSGNYVDETITKEFTKKNPNIKVEFQLLTENNSTEYMQKTDLMIAGGEEFDVVSYSGVNDYTDRVRRNMLVPLDEFIAADGAKYSDMYTISTAVEGKYYALPWDVKPMLVFFNKSYLDEAKLPIPNKDWTWNDYRDYAKKLTKGEGTSKRYGSYFHTWPDFKIFSVSAAYDFWPLVKKDGTSNLLDPNIKDALQFTYDMESVDKSTLPYFEAKSGKLAYRDLFLQGKIAMLPIGIWMVPEISTTLAKYPHDWVTAFAPIPKYKDYPNGATMVSMGWCSIPVTSKHQAEAYQLMKFNSNEGVNIRATGIPAKKDYNIDQILTTMMNGKENLYDAPSLKATVSNLKFNMVTNNFPYNKKVSDAVEAEFEKFLVGGESLDDAIANADKAAKEIIASGK